jgi:zinc and cadmium transporter
MLFSIPLELLALTIFASLVSLIGGIIFLYTKKLSLWLEKYGVPFAAGTMIVTALVGLLPEAMHLLGSSSFMIFTASFLSLYVLEKLLLQLHHHTHSHDEHSHQSRSAASIKSAVPIVLIGDTIHNFIDGVAIAVAYAVNPGLAAVTALSTFLHEVPHEIGDFSILLKAGFSKKKVLVINILSAAVSIFGAVLITYISPGDTVIGTLMAVAAGIFFYLGVVDFLPHAFDSEHNSSFSAKFAVVATVLAGAGIMALSLLAVPHSHEHAHSESDSHGHEEEYHGDEDSHDEASDSELHSGDDDHDSEGETHADDLHDESDADHE